MSTDIFSCQTNNISNIPEMSDCLGKSVNHFNEIKFEMPLKPNSTKIKDESINLILSSNSSFKTDGIDQQKITSKEKFNGVMDKNINDIFENSIFKVLGSEGKPRIQEIYQKRETHSFQTFVGDIIESKYYKIMTFLSIFINIACLILKNEFSDGINSKIKLILSICNFYFLIDSFMVFLSSKSWFLKNGYFRDILNVGHILSICFGILILIDKINKPIFFFWENLRLFKFISFFPRLKSNFNKLISSLLTIGNHIIVVLVVMLAYALIGVFFFKGNLENRCRLSSNPINNHWPTNSSILTLCGENLCPEKNFCGSPADYGLERDESEYSENAILFYGIFNFDNLINSLFTSLSFLSITGWSSINDIYWKSTNKFFTAFYTFSYVFLVSTILLNLVVAGLYENLFKLDEYEKSFNNIENSHNFCKDNMSDIKTIEQRLKSGSQSVKKTLNLSNNYQTVLSRFQLTIASPIMNIRNIKFKKSIIMKFKLLSFIIIILNIIILCIDGPDLSNYLKKTINQVDFAFTLIFYLEIFIKLIFQKDFFVNFLNKIDFILFLLNIIVQTYLIANGFNFINESDIILYNLVRTFQVLRICRLMVSSYWQSVSILINEMIKIMKTMIDFLVVLIIFLILFALIGRDLFKFSNLSEKPTEEEILRINFDNFFNAILANFLIFIGEEWHLIMFAHMKTFSYESAWFFVINLLVSTIFLNKIFLASLINKLIESKNMKKIIQGTYTKSINMSKITYYLDLLKEKIKKLVIYIKNMIHKKKKSSKSEEKYIKKVKNNQKSMQSKSFDSNEKNLKMGAHSRKTFSIKTLNSMKETKFKNFLTQLTKHPYFSNFMIITLTISFIILALHNPYQPNNSQYNLLLRNLDIPIFVIFTFELLAELILHKSDFFSFSILLKISICFIYLFYFIYEIEFLKLLLIIRLFVLINFSKDLKLAFKALFRSLVDILQLFFFFMLVGIFFALIGVKSFKGAFWYCDGLDEEFLQKVIIKQDCLDWGGDWMNHDFNFDNIFKALEIVFFVANTEGWIPLMEYAWDSVGRDMQPKMNYHNRIWGSYFLFYGVLAHFFLINIIIAILVEKYIAVKQKLEHLHLLNSFQKEWRTIKHMIFKMSPKQRITSRYNFQKKLLKILKNKYHKYFFIILNICNLILFTSIYHRESHENVIFCFSFAINMIFVMESLLKIIAKPSSFFKIWQISNFFFIICSLLTFYLTTMSSKPEIDYNFYLSFLLSAQIFRIFLIVKHVKFIKKLLRTFKTILTKSFPIIILFFIVLFFYGLIAFHWFAYLKPQKYANSPDINFSNISYSMFTLFRIATVEQWYLIIADCSRSIQSNFLCDYVSNYDDYQIYGQNGCGSAWAYPFFISFYLVILLIFNLLVGIIINISGTIRKHEESSINIYQLDDIKNLWAKYDPKGTGYMDYKDFWIFSSRIAIILGVKIEDLLDFETKKKFLKILNLNIYEDVKHNNIFCLNFHEVVLSLSKIAVMIKFNVSNLDIKLPGDTFKYKISRSLKAKNNYKTTHLTSGLISNFMDLKSKIRNWRKYSIMKKEKLKNGSAGLGLNSKEPAILLSSLEHVAKQAKLPKK